MNKTSKSSKSGLIFQQEDIDKSKETSKTRGILNLSSVQQTQEMQVRSLSWEDPLKKEMATHSSIIAWKTPWIEKLGGLQFKGSERLGHD